MKCFNVKFIKLSFKLYKKHYYFIGLRCRVTAVKEMQVSRFMWRKFGSQNYLAHSCRLSFEIRQTVRRPVTRTYRKLLKRAVAGVTVAHATTIQMYLIMLTKGFVTFIPIIFLCALLHFFLENITTTQNLTYKSRQNAL